MRFVDEIAAASLSLHKDATVKAESFAPNPNLAKTEMNAAGMLTGEYWVLVTSNFVIPHYPSKALELVWYKRAHEC